MITFADLAAAMRAERDHGYDSVDDAYCGGIVTALTARGLSPTVLPKDFVLHYWGAPVGFVLARLNDHLARGRE